MTIIIDQHADLRSHYIEGYLPDGRHANLPLWSHVEGNLYQGGCVMGVDLPKEFKHVLSLYPWEAYFLDAETDRVEIKMHDSLDQALDQVPELADLVAEMVEDGPTLVHCQAGINRSALVCATYLVRHTGRTPDEAISLLRERRGEVVLANRSFEEYVRAL